MKNILHFPKNVLRIAAICAVIALSSCSNDDSSSFPEQNPLAEYLSKAGFDQSKQDIKDGGDYEFGFSFKPTVKGQINAIVAKIPDAQLEMRVTIWDASTKTALRTELVDIPAAGQEVTKKITPLILEKDKEYIITYNGNDWYDHRKADNSAAVYPITAGDIQITGYGFAEGTAQAFPTVMLKNYYAGDVSFKFQQK